MAGPARSADVEGASCHHRCHRRGAGPGGGGPPVGGLAGLDRPAAGPLPGQRGGGVRAAVAAAEDPSSAISPEVIGLITGLRKELAGQGLDAGPHTIAWHLEHQHEITVPAAAAVSRYLARAGLVVPDPAKRPKSSCIRFAAELPNECWQAGHGDYQLGELAPRTGGHRHD